MAEQVSRTFGGARVLVNNAGISLLGPAEQTTLAQWRRVLSVNLDGTFYVTRAFLDDVVARARRRARASGRTVAAAQIVGDRDADRR